MPYVGALEANVMGIVVNGVGSRQARGYGKGSDAGQYYGYGYGYSYGADQSYYSEYYDESRPAKNAKSKRSNPKSSVSSIPVAVAAGQEVKEK